MIRLAIIAVVLVFSAVAHAQDAKLTVAVPFPAKPPVCCMAVPAAKDLGYYKAQGLDVTIVNVGTASTGTIQTLVANRADIATASVASGFGAYVAGAKDVRFIGAELNSINSLNKMKWFYAAKTAITKVEDLKGKTIGIPAGPNPTDPVYVQISALIASVGMTDKDVRWTVAGAPATRIQALLAGRIDFTAMPMEMSYAITPGKGVHLIFFDPVGANTGWAGCQCWFTTGKALSDPAKREAMQKFVTATTLAVRDMARDKELFKKAMGLYIDMSLQTPASIDNTWNFYRVQYLSNGGVNLGYMNEWLTKVYFPTVNPNAAGKVTLKDIVDPSLVKTFIDKHGADASAYWDPPQLAFP